MSGFVEIFSVKSKENLYYSYRIWPWYIQYRFAIYQSFEFIINGINYTSNINQSSLSEISWKCALRLSLHIPFAVNLKLYFLFEQVSELKYTHVSMFNGWCVCVCAGDGVDMHSEPYSWEKEDLRYMQWGWQITIKFIQTPKVTES